MSKGCTKTRTMIKEIYGLSIIHLDEEPASASVGPDGRLVVNDDSGPYYSAAIRLDADEWRALGFLALRLADKLEGEEGASDG